jgi:hypothetical protein
MKVTIRQTKIIKFEVDNDNDLEDLLGVPILGQDAADLIRQADFWEGYDGDFELTVEVSP